MTLKFPRQDSFSRAQTRVNNDLTRSVEDPLYIRGDYLTSTHYPKEKDGSKWDPSAQSALSR